MTETVCLVPFLSVLELFDLPRISGRRTQTTCVQTLWRCYGVATAPMCGNSSAWTQWPCFDGASCAPPSEALLLLMKLAAPGPPKPQVHYWCDRVRPSGGGGDHSFLAYFGCSWKLEGHLESSDIHQTNQGYSNGRSSACYAKTKTNI